MQYQNPILYADYSDPDVIRVGKDYYMVASSFTYLPGVPLLHSKDLVHWEIINYCVPSLPFEKYNQPSHGSGTWAPSIRYHEGTFYVFVPLPDEGIFVARSQDPYGAFVLNQLCASVGWIDPCPLWDDDGKAYMVFAYARSRCGIKHRLSVVEMDPDCTKLLGEPVEIFNGEQIAPTTEGPKFYKYNGLYYILAPSGGVATGWQSCFRSKSVYGPYEYKIVMHQGDSAVNGPHQGGWITGEDGRHWFVHFQDVIELGRITHLQPMCFLDGWPFIGQDTNGDGIGEPVSSWDLPAEGKPQYRIAASDDFPNGLPGLQWQWQSNPQTDLFLSKKVLPNTLRLCCLANRSRDNLLWYAPNALTQIPQAPAFTATVQAALSLDGKTGDMAALGMIGHTYAYLGLQRTEGGFRLALYRGTVSVDTYAGEAEETLDVSFPVSSGTLFLQLQLTEDKQYRFFWSLDGTSYQPIGGAYPLQRATWTGAKLALWGCNRDNRTSKGVASFLHFQVLIPGLEDTDAAQEEAQGSPSVNLDEAEENKNLDACLESLQYKAPQSLFTTGSAQGPRSTQPFTSLGPEYYNDDGVVDALELEITMDLERYTARRTIVVPETTTFRGLHNFIQAAFRWKDYHLHEFVLPPSLDRKTELHVLGEGVDLYDGEPILSEWDYKVTMIDLLGEGMTFRYNYDFGDSWHLDIKAVRYHLAWKTDLPICTLYEGAAPPEDVGGVGGYLNFCDILSNPDHEEYADKRSWAGRAWFNPYSAEAITRKLRAVPKKDR